MWLIALLTQFAALLAVAGDRPADREILHPPRGEVSIIRDRWGMVHLYASREEDGFWGLGYATGEDRLISTLFSYLTVKGELAAAFGRAAIPAAPELNRLQQAVLVPDPVMSDRFALRGRFLADARQNFPRLSSQLQANMKSYIRGLEHYMAEHPERVPDWATGLEPALPLALFAMTLFSPQDNVCLAKLDAQDKLSGTPAVPPRALQASNAWVLGGKRTASGKVIFGADSHGAVEPAAGSFFYPWRMHAQDIDLFALEATGTAVPLFGHSRHFAWGWTEGPRQSEECVRVVTHQNDPRAYDVDGQTRHMEVEPYEIRVKGEPPITGEFEYLKENGVRSAVMYRDAQAAYAIRFVYQGRAGFAPEQHRNLALARSAEDLRAVFASGELYPANLLAGGADGTLVYIRPGRIARRPPGFDSEKFTNGNSSASAWLGLHPLDDLVQVWNPPQAYLVNDNVSPESLFEVPSLRARDYPSYFMMQPGLTDNRQQQHIELFSDARNFTFSDAEGAIFDDNLTLAISWAHKAAELLREDVAGEDPELQAMTAELESFDGRFVSESAGALYTALTIERVSSDVELPLRLSLAEHLDSGADLSPDERRALLAAVLKVRDELKTRCSTVLINFGDVFRVGRGPVRAASSGFAVSLSAAPKLSWTGGLQWLWLASPHAGVYDGWNTACQRDRIGGTRAPFLVSFTEPLESHSMLMFGVSDDPASIHYSDQSLLDSRGRLKPNYFDADSLLQHIESVIQRQTR